MHNFLYLLRRIGTKKLKLSTSIWPVHSVVAAQICAYIDTKGIITAVFNITAPRIRIIRATCNIASSNTVVSVFIYKTTFCIEARQRAIVRTNHTIGCAWVRFNGAGTAHGRYLGHFDISCAQHHFCVHKCQHIRHRFRCCCRSWWTESQMIIDLDLAITRKKLSKICLNCRLHLLLGEYTILINFLIV